MLLVCFVEHRHTIASEMEIGLTAVPAQCSVQMMPARALLPRANWAASHKVPCRCKPSIVLYESICMLNAAGSQKDLGQTAFPALANGKGPARKGKGKSKDEARTTGDPILDTGNSTLEMIPASGAETIV